MSEWSIAQVLSHIGSQAEIFGLFLDAGLSGQDPPGPDAFPDLETWNAKSPQDQAADALRADEAVTARFESLDDDQRKRFRLSLFGMDLDAAGLARMRLGERAVHTWDIAVASDPAATLAPDAVGLLIDTLRPARGQGRQAGRDSAAPARVDEQPGAALHAGDRRQGHARGLGVARACPSWGLHHQAFVRLVYGRLDPALTPAIETNVGGSTSTTCGRSSRASDPRRRRRSRPARPR